MKRFLFVAWTLLSTSCVPLLAAAAPGASVAAKAVAEGGYEPAMLELDTAVGDDGQWHLLIAGGLHTTEDTPRTRYALSHDASPPVWRDLYVWKQFHDGPAWFGGAVLSERDGTFHQSYNGKAPVLTGPGTYMLQLDLAGQHVDVPVTIAQIKVTNGQPGYVIDPVTYQQQAALRFDRDVHGIDIGYPHDPRLWITLRAAMTRDRTQADFFWYRGDTFVAQSSQQRDLGGIGLSTPFEHPVRFWTWPKEMSFEEEVQPQNATWKVVVYQDGAYATTCTFEIAGGKVTGRAKSSAPVACKKVEASADATRRAAQLKVGHEDPMRKKELLALSVSEETRKVLRELIELNRDQGDAMMSRGMAVEAEDNAWTSTQAKRAAAKYEGANAALKDTNKAIEKLTRRYGALVLKYGNG